MDPKISQPVSRPEPNSGHNRLKNDSSKEDVSAYAIEKFAKILEQADQTSSQKFIQKSDLSYKSEPSKDKNNDIHNKDEQDSEEAGDHDEAQALPPDNQLLKNMLSMMSRQVQLIMLPPIEAKQWASNPVQTLQTTVDQVVAHVEKVDKSAYHFKIQGQELEIRVDKKNGTMHITIYAPKELSKDLSEYRYQLSDHLKTKLDSNDVLVDFESLPEGHFNQQQQGQQHSRDKNSQEDKDNQDEKT